MTTKESFVALLKIALVSNISLMNVLTPFNWLSPAPTRHKMESKIGNSASWQGTNEPIWASKAINPVCRMKTDFPPALGPVMIENSETSYTKKEKRELVTE